MSVICCYSLLCAYLQNRDEGASSDEENAVDNNAIPGTPPSKKVCTRFQMHSVFLETGHNYEFHIFLLFRRTVELNG